MFNNFFRKFFFVICFVSPIMLLAEEDHGAHHEVHFYDLKWQVVNFAILFVGLAYLTRKKIAAHFDNYSSEVEKLINYAQDKDREAQIKLEMFQKKIETFEQQKQKIDQDTKQDLEKYEAQTQLDFKNETNRVMRDAENKLETEKKLILSQLYTELVQKVVENTKEKFVNDKVLKEKATDKIISQIG